MGTECEPSPSTSLDRTSSINEKENDISKADSVDSKSSKGRVSATSTRRLIRVPCVPNAETPFTIQGGAALARLITVDMVRQSDLVGLLNPGDVILTIDEIPVSGMLRSTAQALLEAQSVQKDQLAIEVLAKDAIPDDLCLILSEKEYPELQTVIRDNVYARTVPFTTRDARDGEVDGEHYRFVTVEHFNELKDGGHLLEHGTYQGHLYGTPRPTEMVSGPSKGPLPPNWEIAYDDQGEKYFIDHNTGTTHWEDPRDLPVGWEQVDDPVYGTFYVDHVNKRTTYDRPGTSSAMPPPARPTSYPVNGHDSSPGSRMSRRDLAGMMAVSHNPYFTTDPMQLRGEILRTTIIKGPKGLGFTLIGNDASSKGDEFIQVKSILAGGPAASNGVLQPGDVLVRVNQNLLLGATQADACQIFVSIPQGEPVDLEVCRGYPLVIDPANRIVTQSVYDGHRNDDLFDISITKGTEGFGFTIADNANGQRVRKIIYPAQCPNLLEGDVICELDGRDVRGVSHTQLVDMLRELPVGHRGRLAVRRISATKNRSRTPVAAPTLRYRTPGWGGYGSMRGSASLHGFSTTPNYMPLAALQMDQPFNHMTVNLIRKPQGFGFRLLGGNETGTQLTVGQIVPGGAAADDGRLKEGDEIMEIDGVSVEGAAHGDAVGLLEKAARQQHVKLLVRRHQMNGIDSARSASLPPSMSPHAGNVAQEYDVVLERQETEGFGFVILSNMVRRASNIGELIPGSPAARCGRLRVGDRVLRVNGNDIAGLPHADIVNLIKNAGLTVRLTVCQDTGPAMPKGAAGPTYAPSYSHPTPVYGGYSTVQQTPSHSTLPPPIHSAMRSNGYSPYDAAPPGHQEDDLMEATSLARCRFFVLRIAEDGAAAADGRLRVGDHLVEINGTDTRGLSHEEAINLIKQHPTVRLRIARHRLPTH
ncbi:unnamed protein product, partial [Mesorhabditis spiculigera]